MIWSRLVVVTPLACLADAASEGKINIVKVLIEYKAGIDAKDGISRTPLHLAAFKGSEPCQTTLMSSPCLCHVLLSNVLFC